MENQSPEPYYEDVRKCGYLRKQKSMHKRYFVLRAASERGPARLEYYENEKKFRGKTANPKKVLNLETCFNINKRADAKNKHLIVVYTREESFSIAAESEADQGDWYQAMVELQCKSKVLGESPEYGALSPGPAFKEVWQVKVWPKGLGQSKSLVGIYRLCLTDKTVNFVKLNSDAAAVVLQLMNVRRCGHSENFFFVEVGRSAVTGPGEFWMQVEDSVVAQNMHETLLEAMKALSEEFRQRSKSQSSAGAGAGAGGGCSASHPISVPSRRHHPHPPPSQVGFARRPRTETPGAGSASTSPTPRHGFPRARTASDGARPGQEDAPPAGGGSPDRSGSVTPTLRPKSARAAAAATPAAKTALGPAKSALAPSPAPSLSSSSGHGSEGGGGAGAYPRAARGASVSGSPSDYGSSDEYGSSPGEQAPLSSQALTSDPCGGEDASNYIAMGRRAAAAPQARRVLRRSSSRESEAERQLLSKRASLPPMALDKPAPRRGPRAGDEAEEDYAVMARSTSRESCALRRSSSGGSYLELPGGGHGADNGYMAMLPGVAASGSGKPDDYMAMTPNSSVSPPQQIQGPRPSPSDGYMMMSPNSSCSPDQRLGGGSDYMNMSPLSGRSASSTPPEREPQAEPPPRMVYSYYSLPRSYKHASNPPAGFGEAGGGGRGPSASGGGGGRGLSNGTGPPRRTQDRGPEGRLLSSSSYSSSSASSESLGEGDERPNGRGGGVQVGGGARAKEGPQRRAGQPRSRPVSLFVDVSKANTLPRVREAPLPPEPKSPGEYVSIEYRGGGVPGIPHPSGPARPLQRPGSCLGGLHGHSSPEPHASEYVNMDLGPLLAPLGFPGYPTPAAAPLAFDEHRPDLEPSEEPGRGKHGASVPEESPTFGDYTEMAFSLGPPSPRSASPGGVASVGLGLDFPLSKPTPNPDQGAKVIRADPQGRRRHCSETFLATQSLPPSSSSSSSSSSFSLFPDHAQAAARRLAFDGVWGKGGACDGANEPAPLCAIPGSPAVPVAQAPPSSSSSSMEQGLNYIDLDLASKDSPHATLEAAPSAQVASRLYSSGLVADGGGSAAVLNTYASIDFYKSEELRAHQSSSKEGTEC
ncbi:insulin receptor substrate 1 [Lepisosteus oculatus]|uniref:insulin receptor substrate 1 n=1 Tax=Lepisosteus oculatus TaxID=7918 RepID=UPI003719E1FE